MRPLFFASVLALAGCAAGTPHTQFDGGPDAQSVWPDSGADAGPRDAGSVDASSTDAGSMDAGSIDAGTIDAGHESDGGASDGGAHDGGARDSGASDGGATMDAGWMIDAGPGLVDGGPPSIVVDGVIDSAEWAGAEEATSTTATEWSGDELHRLLATVRDGALYVAVEGTVEGNNAIVIYVDDALGDSAGASIESLGDDTGSLDNAISPSLTSFTTPSAFLADHAWGTQDLSRAASGFDARMGWRDISTSPSDFGWIDSAVAPTVCGAAACETSIPLATLGGTSPRTIALFARIDNWDGTASPNQTLPSDDPANPRTVSMLLLVSY